MSKLIIGVTGGIGSGKTAVTDFFAARDIAIVDADLAARVVVEPGREALQKIADRHGEEILLADGNLDRRKLRDIIFKDAREKDWLEALLHPLIRIQIEQALTSSLSPYSILVSPLLVETDQHILTQRILVVDVPVEVQIQRTMERDGMTEEQTLAIIRQQASREERLAKADDVVDNSGSLPDLHHQLDRLHEKYMKLL